jgi:iron complex transport system substrate-binding protein
MALSCLFAIACYSPVIPTLNLSANDSPYCQVVRHQLGETCVPHVPKRIVALAPEIVDPLLALDIQPIGIAVFSYKGVEDLAGLISNDIKGIPKVGVAFQPSLERITNLNPDLILGMPYHAAIYRQLSLIAPTVLVEHQRNEPIKNYLRYFAKVLDKEVEAEKILSQYQARISKLQKQMNQQAQEIEVTVLMHYDSIFLLPEPSRATHELFSDIGFIDNVSNTSSDLNVTETLDQYDADILFIISGYGEKSKSSPFQNPLIAALNSVKDDRAYIVDAYKWYPAGILGLNRLLDDMLKYLLNEQHLHQTSNLNQNDDLQLRSST